MNDTDAKGDVLSALSFKDCIGTDMSCREMDAINEHGTFSMLPINPCFCVLAAYGFAIKLAVMSGWPYRICLLLPVSSVSRHNESYGKT